MVKVKVIIDKSHPGLGQRFNHPMVKVKAINSVSIGNVNRSFNHPMVKVKGDDHTDHRRHGEFQPPYGES